MLVTVEEMGREELKAFREKVFYSLLEPKEKGEILAKIDKRFVVLGIDEALIPLSEGATLD